MSCGTGGDTLSQVCSSLCDDPDSILHSGGEMIGHDVLSHRGGYRRLFTVKTSKYRIGHSCLCVSAESDRELSTRFMS